MREQRALPYENAPLPLQAGTEQPASSLDVASERKARCLWTGFGFVVLAPILVSASALPSLASHDPSRPPLLVSFAFNPSLLVLLPRSGPARALIQEPVENSGKHLGPVARPGVQQQQQRSAVRMGGTAVKHISRRAALLAATAPYVLPYAASPVIAHASEEGTMSQKVVIKIANKELTPFQPTKSLLSALNAQCDLDGPWDKYVEDLQAFAQNECGLVDSELSHDGKKSDNNVIVGRAISNKVELTEGWPLFHQVLQNEELRNILFNSGGINVDLGGGKYDFSGRMLEALIRPVNKEFQNIVIDKEPMRSKAYTDGMKALIKQAGGAKTATSFSVLNICSSKDAMKEHLQELKSYLSPGGVAIIFAWEGNLSRNFVDNTGLSGGLHWSQQNQPMDFYIPVVKEVFGRLAPAKPMDIGRGLKVIVAGEEKHLVFHNV